MKSAFAKTLVVLSLSALCVAANAYQPLDQKPHKPLRPSALSPSDSEVISIAVKLRNFYGNRVAFDSVTYKSPLATALSNGKAQRINLNAIAKQNTAGIATRIYWDERNSTPIFMSGSKSPLYKSAGASATTPSQTALSFITKNRDVFRLRNPVDELQVKREKEDSFGKRHIVFQQRYQGIPVWGHELVAHLEPNGDLYLINGRYSPTPENLDISARRISQIQAVDIALQDLSAQTEVKELDDFFKERFEYDGPQAEIYIWVDDQTRRPHLIWHVTIRPNIRDEWYYFVDAHSGEILQFYNNTKFDGPVTATATDLNGVVRAINTYEFETNFYMIDASRPMWNLQQSDLIGDPKGALWTIDARNTDAGPLYNVISSDNTWSDPVSVSAHYNVGETFDYYFSTFGRNSFDDSGSTMLSVIHLTKNGQSREGASWTTGDFIIYGDGGASFKPRAGGLDVAAHEMTHGVIVHTVNLEYISQSGALNESFADVFGAMVDRDNWLIGEDVVKLTAYPSGALRNLADPHNGGTSLADRGWQPSHMNEFQVLTPEQDSGGVHVNSGIVNRAAYLIGSTIGKDKLEQIYYRILDAHYLTRQSQFVDMRLAALRATAYIYGNQSAEVNVVATAFDAVGIFDGSPTEQPADIDPVVGEEWVAVVNAEPTDNSLYLVNPDIPSSAINQLTTTQVFTGTGSPLSVDRDGTGIVFIDNANFIRVIGTDGSSETVISATGEWFSVALSPQGDKLAVTSIYADSTIYIIDLVNPDSSKAIHLYSHTSEGSTLDITLYADALDWNLTGEYILFDAFNSIPQALGGAISYWDIAVVHVASSIILPVLPPAPDGIHLGNPAFASTNDIYIVVDLIDENTGAVKIIGINLFTGEVGLIQDNGTSIGYPQYSSDDSRIVFQRIIDGEKTLLQQALDTSKINPVGIAEEWIFQGSLPTWFTIASAGCCEIAGDADGGGEFNIGDAVFLVKYIFQDGPEPSCFDQADASGSNEVNIGDAVYVVLYIFKNGPAPVCGTTGA